MELYDIQRIAQLDNERLRYETAAEILEGIIEKMEPHTTESAAIGFTIGYLKGRIANICTELENAEVDV